MLTIDEWKNHGVCTNSPEPDLFFPVRGTSSRAAKALCASCPVRQECLEAALRLHPQEDWGIWGGTSRDERRQLRAERVITHTNQRFLVREEESEIRPVSV